MKNNHIIAIAGANGFVRRHLRDTFDRVIILHRDDNETILLDKLKGVEVVINLAKNIVGLRLTTREVLYR